MKENPKISVIVPIYKVEKYLEQCIESIIHQTYQNLEIILVDDGSPDKCPEICDDYAKKDKRIRVIHKTNGGLGAAYNTGLNAATGEYIGFVEPDDWIAPEMYEKLYNQLSAYHADVCFGSWYYHTDKSDMPDKEIKENSESNKLFSISDHPFLETVHPSIWAKLYRAELLANLRFPEYPGAGYCDALFYVKILCATNKLISLPEPLYYYRTDNENSSSHNTVSDKSLMGIIRAWQDVKNWLQKCGRYEELKEGMYFHALKPTFRFFCNIKKKYKKEFFEKFRAFIADLKTDKTFTYKWFEGSLLNQKRKSFIEAALENNFKKACYLRKYDKIKMVSFCGIPILTKLSSPTKEKTVLLGIKVKSVKIAKNKKVKKVLGGIFKTRKTPTKVKKYFLGIKVKSKHRKISDSSWAGVFNNSDMNEKEVSMLRQFFLAAYNHKETFLPYKAKFAGKDLYLIACGPTLTFFLPPPPRFFKR